MKPPTQKWIRQLQGQLKVAQMQEKKASAELKRQQALIAERDHEIEKLTVTNQMIRSESSKVIQLLRSQLANAVRKQDQLSLQLEQGKARQEQQQMYVKKLEIKLKQEAINC